MTPLICFILFLGDWDNVEALKVYFNGEKKQLSGGWQTFLSHSGSTESFR